MDPFSEISSMVMTPVTASVNTTVNSIPLVIGAVIVLIIGWIVGRVLGKAVSVLIDKLGFEKSIGKTTIGKAFLQTGWASFAEIGDFIVRIIVYLFAIMAAADILGITYLAALIEQMIAYIPSLVAFVIILLVGLILVDYFADFVIAYGEHGERGLQLVKPIISIFRVFLYFIVIMLALTQLKIDLGIIYAFITPVAWGVGIGIGAALAIIVGFGLKDQAPELFEKLLGKF